MLDKIITKLVRNYPFSKGKGWFTYSSFARYVQKNLGKFEKVKIFDGSYLWVDPRDYIGATIFFFRDFDKSISKLLSDLLKKGDVFVDVGASCGIESIPCAKIVGQKGRVFSFEPHEISYNLLSKSLLENKLNNVVTMPFAVCSNDETKSLSVQPDNYGLSSILAFEEGHIPVKCIKLDSIKYLLNTKIKILKIDTEGHELEVLKGAKEIFEVNKPDYVIIELLPKNTVHLFDREEYKFLKSYGYRARQIKKHFCDYRLTDLSRKKISTSSADYIFSKY